ncbi:hypothetical protein KAI04_00070 [Candidatus Pacearchaeota archaeon]|nr:hypothetical protein [Candidatus Pacearchaeota archaeon]
MKNKKGIVQVAVILIILYILWWIFDIFVLGKPTSVFLIEKATNTTIMKDYSNQTQAFTKNIFNVTKSFFNKP